MLAAKVSGKMEGRPGAIPVNNERTCSQCRHWDLEHVQRTALDDDTIPIEEFFARCRNANSPCWSRFIEAHDGCGDFEPR